SGIYFHDGTPFNATAVKWNFDRLNHFLNYSGNDYLPPPFNVPATELSFTRGIYSFLGKPIINETIVVNATAIKLKLNVPKASIINILAYCGAYILSPTSTPPLRVLNYGLNDTLVGTGPFMYDYYLTDVEVKMHANPNYWMGPPKIDTLTFKIYSNHTLMNEALLMGDVDVIDQLDPDYLDTFEANPNITLVRGAGTFHTEYVCMNPARVNKTWREAISYAIDYDNVINTLMDGNAERLKSPIPEGIWASNYTLNYPIFNLTKARLLIQSIGLGVGLDIYNDADWEAQSTTDPFVTFTFWVQNDSSERQAYASYVANQTDKLIGIEIEYREVTFVELVYDGIIGSHLNPLQQWGSPPRYFDMWAIGWAPDYLDPENYVNEFFHSGSALSVGYSNSYLDALMDTASMTLPPYGPVRKAYYDEIQQILIEDDMPFAWLFTTKNIDAYKKEVGGYITNRDNRVYIYPCYWKEVNITHPSDITYIEGQTGNNISWNITSNFVESPYYDLYVDDVFNKTDTWASGIPVTINVDGLPVGTHEYRIEVHNGDLDTEDTVYVEVLDLDSLPIDITHPSNITYLEGLIGYFCIWNITSDYVISPSYNLYVNDVLNKTDTWVSGIPVIINVDGLPAGTHEYRIEVHNGNTIANDTAYVKVLTISQLKIDISHPLNLTYIEGQTGYSLMWTITSEYIVDHYYNLYIDDMFNTTDTWESGIPVIINVDGLPVGTHEYRIEVHNGIFTENDTTYVEVLSLNALPIDISRPSNITYTEGQTGHYIVWTITSDFIANPSYNLYLNDVLNSTDIWASGVPIAINVDGHSAGTYEYRIEVHNGNTIETDTVYVFVEPRRIAPPAIYGYPVVTLLLICFSSIIFIFIRKKKKISK
ncbi:MAG: ABC transporter substrate-binding protein, partial [Candidatus Hodarchaeota archaeon]